MILPLENYLMKKKEKQQLQHDVPYSVYNHYHKMSPMAFSEENSNYIIEFFTARQFDTSEEKLLKPDIKSKIADHMKVHQKELYTMREELSSRYPDKSKEVIDDMWVAHNIIQSCVHSWVQYRQIYKFSRELLDALCLTEMKTIGWDLFKSLPYPTMFLDLSDASDIAGVFIRLNYNNIFSSSDGVTFNMIAVNKKDKLPCSCVSWTVPYDEISMSEFTSGDNTHNMSDQLLHVTLLIMNCLCYLSVANKEMQSTATYNHVVYKYNPKKHRSDKIDHTVQEWSIGYRKTSYIKKVGDWTRVSGEGVHKSPRPHIRRGHFHRHWMGPKDKQELVPMWQEPCFVNCLDASSLPTVENSVEVLSGLNTEIGE